MGRYGFSGGGAQQAIQDFLVQREMQQRQQEQDARAQQVQEQDHQQKLADLKLRQEQEKRAAEAQKTTQAELANEREFRKATTIQQNALPGDAVDAPTNEMMVRQGYGGQIKQTPGIVAQGAFEGNDAQDVPQYDVTKSPDSYTMRGGESYLSQRAAADERAAAADAAAKERDAAATQQQTFTAGQNDLNRQNTRAIADATRAAAGDALVKVEHKDPTTGRTVIEYLPKSEVRGQKYDKGTSATTETRLASAEAVTQTGQDIISKLSDPAFASQVGPSLGRYNNLRDFIGDPPPEFAELAGQIESYAIANMGVHGMRSSQGAEKIAEMLNKKHTPQSLVATVNGLNAFAQHFMENEGRAPSPKSTTAGGSSFRVVGSR